MAPRASAPLRWARAALRATFSAFGATAKSLSLIPSYLAGLLWLISQQFLDLATQGYGGNACVYSCLRLLSQSVPEPPLHAFSRDASGEPGEQLPYTHPLMRLIREPNELMTEFEFWELVTLHVGISGISHWWKERNARGDLIALWPLRPDRVGPIYSESDLPGMKVLSGWSYLIPGTTHYVPIARRDVLTFNFPNPGGESGGLVEGLGPLQVLAAEVGADNEATKFVGSMLANYGAPGVVLTVKTPLRSEDDARLIKAAFVREFGGSRRGLPGVVDAETTIQQLGFDLGQLEFPNLRRISEARIAAAFGVPAIMVGLLVGLEAGIRATIAEQREYFAETTLANYWRRFSDQFTKDVAGEFGPGIVCRFDVSCVKALAQQAQQDAQTLRDAVALGTVTVNEYRERALNLPPREDGDRYVTGVAPGTGEETYVPASPATPGSEDQVAMPQQPQRSATGAARRTPHAERQRITVSGHPAHGSRERVAAAYAAWAADHGAHSLKADSNGHGPDPSRQN